MSSEIRDISLAPSGHNKIEWVRRNCDLLRTLYDEFSKTKPFAGKKIALSVHLEAKKLDLKGIPVEELPKLGKLLKKTYQNKNKTNNIIY